MFAVPELAALADGWAIAIDDVVKIGSDVRIAGRVASKSSGS